MAWVIVDESCELNFQLNGSSYRTIPKELIVLEIVLAGEPLNDTSVDCVFVRYEGKYAIELPYNEVTIGVTTYASAELLRAAIETLMDTNPCAGGGAGTLDDTLTAGNTTTQSAIFDDGMGAVNTISPVSVLITDGTNISTFQAGAVINDNGAGTTSTLASGSLQVTDGVTSSVITESRISTNTMTLTGLTNYADNAAAILGGLTAGELYYTSNLGTATLKIVI